MKKYISNCIDNIIVFGIILSLGSLMNTSNFHYFSNFNNDKDLIEGIVLEAYYWPSFLGYVKIEAYNKLDTDIYAHVLPYSIFKVKKNDVIKIKDSNNTYYVCPNLKDYWGHTVIIWILNLLLLYLAFQFLNC